MKLPTPPGRYERDLEARRNRILELESKRTRKRGEDLELGDGERLILRSPDGNRWALTVDNTGALGTEAL